MLLGCPHDIKGSNDAYFWAMGFTYMIVLQLKFLRVIGHTYKNYTAGELCVAAGAGAEGWPG